MINLRFINQLTQVTINLTIITPTLTTLCFLILEPLQKTKNLKTYKKKMMNKIFSKNQKKTPKNEEFLKKKSTELIILPNKKSTYLIKVRILYFV